MSPEPEVVEPVALATREVALPEPVTRRNISEAQWRTLMNNLYPGASAQSVLMVWDYCLARRLDPLKKPCHIVPMRVKDKSGEWVWRDVVMAGIYEYRTTAQRTGEYLGHSRVTYGPIIEHAGVKAPEWCELTVYRAGKQFTRIEFPVRRYFAEVVGTTRDGKANERWTRAPIQMLEKCTEAAGLREAFPDEFGGAPTAEEMPEHLPESTPKVRRLSATPPPVPTPAEEHVETFGPVQVTRVERTIIGYAVTLSNNLAVHCDEADAVDLEKFIDTDHTVRVTATNESGGWRLLSFVVEA